MNAKDLRASRAAWLEASAQLAMAVESTAVRNGRLLAGPEFQLIRERLADYRVAQRAYMGDEA